MLADTPAPLSPAALLCPCCMAGRTELERIPRGALVKTFFFWVSIKHYKCYKCKRKKWILDKPPVKNPAQKKTGCIVIEIQSMRVPRAYPSLKRCFIC